MEAEPSPRRGPFTATVEGRFCVWGGLTDDFSTETNEVASSLHFLNPLLKHWEIGAVKGPQPPGLYAGACAPVGYFLYLFGGTGGQDSYSSFHRLDTKTLELTPLDCHGPMRKGWCGMIHFSNKLLLFGGYGIPSGHLQEGATFIPMDNKKTNGVGWTNELHVYDITQLKG